jgi:hypothetical protein
MGYRKKPKANFRQGKIPIGPRVIKRFDGDHVVSESVDRLAQKTGKSLLQLEKEGQIAQIRRGSGSNVWDYKRVTVHKGLKYDRVLLDGGTVASRNNLTGNMSGAADFFKYFKLLDGKPL